MTREAPIDLDTPNLPRSHALRDETPREPSSQREAGCDVGRFFTRRGRDPFDDAGPWARRDARITGADGTVVFEQPSVEVPAAWSQLATNVVAQKYFRGALDSPDRECSVRTLISRVADSIADWGHADGYLTTEQARATFRDELVHLLVTQRAAFNSPVWFNVGIEERPQCSACFIQSVDDSMESIMTLAKNEGMLFKYGSGTGTNLSPLRGRNETLRGGGTASGPVSFMKGFDAFAGVIKSGGKTRRAAKMVVLNVDHPDIREFIHCKRREEHKALMLIAGGYDPAIDGDAYGSVFFQNANHSVRVTDAFMRAVMDDDDIALRAVTTGMVVDRVSARQLFREIAETTWQCGDPGLQFDDTINAWHTCPNAGRINASNPCSEYVFLDDSACNLASLNLRRFQDATGDIDLERLKHAIDVMILAQEIIVDRARYPTDTIADNSHRFRPLGLGFANLGAFLMVRGVPYDSRPARAYAGALTAYLHGCANLASAKIAAHKGPFDAFDDNRAAVIQVMEKHADVVEGLDAALVPHGLLEATRTVWGAVVDQTRDVGLRNAQTTLVAPTGTIAFLMDCDTTGIEPDIALVKQKMLVGGGSVEVVNRSVGAALARLGYDVDARDRINTWILRTGGADGAPDLQPEHLPVFDCALPAGPGGRAIQPRGHLEMMAAIQPFISGAISKTVNLPADATVDDVERAYLDAWKLGLKAVAIYRDGSKGSQPLQTKRNGNGKSHGRLEDLKPGEAVSTRQKLPSERRSITKKLEIGGEFDGYLTVGLYDDGRVGEIFVNMAKEGSTISGLIDSFATAVSIGLQYGVPLEVFAKKFSHARFEPSGFTSDKEIGHAKSIVDYIFRWLQDRFPGGREAPGENESAPTPAEARTDADHAICPTCGTVMRPNGSCHVCPSCGTTSGCS